VYEHRGLPLVSTQPEPSMFIHQLPMNYQVSNYLLRVNVYPLLLD
jgi:hypothetical protein